LRDDERFEVMRALDQLPQVAGASFATVWFRMAGIRRPMRQEYRERVARNFEAACLALETFPDEAQYAPIKKYIRGRLRREVDDIMRGENREIEKRYNRYVDYG
jgi:hypothetical protein